MMRIIDGVVHIAKRKSNRARKKEKRKRIKFIDSMEILLLHKFENMSFKFSNDV